MPKTRPLAGRGWQGAGGSPGVQPPPSLRNWKAPESWLTFPLILLRRRDLSACLRSEAREAPPSSEWGEERACSGGLGPRPKLSSRVRLEAPRSAPGRVRAALPGRAFYGARTQAERSEFRMRLRRPCESEWLGCVGKAAPEQGALGSPAGWATARPAAAATPRGSLSTCPRPQR